MDDEASSPVASVGSAARLTFFLFRRASVVAFCSAFDLFLSSI